jgi:hypothetical protein
VTEFPETCDSLLAQVRPPANREAWDQFALKYRPAIQRTVHRRGLQDADGRAHVFANVNHWVEGQRVRQACRSRQFR